MQKMQCEMCGGRDFLKQDGLFVCNHCGMKYSPEEARKLLIEVKGSVAVENLPQVSSLLLTAKSLSDKGEHEASKALYIQVLSLDPENPEATVGLGTQITWLVTYNTMNSLSQIVCDGEKAIELAHNRYGDSDEFYSFLNETVFNVAGVESTQYSFIRQKIYEIDGSHDEFSRGETGVGLLLNGLLDRATNKRAVSATLTNLHNQMFSDISSFILCIDKFANDPEKLNEQFHKGYLTIIAFRYFFDFNKDTKPDLVAHDVSMSQKLKIPASLEFAQKLSKSLNVTIGVTSAQSQSQQASVLSSGTGSWACPSCGRVNANYVGTCACGKTKPLVVNASYTKQGYQGEPEKTYSASMPKESKTVPTYVKVWGTICGILILICLIIVISLNGC